MDPGRRGLTAMRCCVVPTVHLITQAIRIGIALHPPTGVEEAGLLEVVEAEAEASPHSDLQPQARTQLLWVRAPLAVGMTTLLVLMPTPERRPVPRGHHHTGVARPCRGPVGGVVLAQMVLAGVLVPIATKTHRPVGRMSLVLQASRRHRLSGVPRQRNGERLATSGGPPAVRGVPLERIWDLVGEKSRFRTRAANHLRLRI